jgi:prolyl-tRNA synthetase
MKASKLLLPTLKEVPNEASIPSHIYLLRGGFVRSLVGGVYTYLPLGLKVLNKIENIIKDEMNKSGALEILCSALQPRELWEESKRWSKYGPELMRLKDRHDREFCLGPTHEEIFTDLVRNEVKTKKQLPLILYQVQTKYRDEMRPRFGLIRSREFLMKDAYSFDIDENSLDVSYDLMYKTYDTIFKRLSLNCKAVLADTGAIGGNASHQFMALSDIGESTIIYCDCSYAYDQEKAISKARENKESPLPLTIVETIGKKSIDNVSEFLKVDKKKIVKSLIYYIEPRKQFVMACTLGDKEVNVLKIINHYSVAEFEVRLASESEIYDLGLVNGYVGPKSVNIPVLIDFEVSLNNNLVIGANSKNNHYINANYGIDFTGELMDLNLVTSNDICPICGKSLKEDRGIEVGQVFKLGTKYSQSMNCNYLDETGLHPMVMGCYGIGVSRCLASIIEQHHDDFGISWPTNIAPYEVVIIPTLYSDDVIKELSDKIYNTLLQKGIDVVLDERDSKAGFKFKDWELIGVPYQIIVGRGAGNNIVEFKTREGLIKEELTTEQSIERVIKNVR